MNRSLLDYEEFSSGFQSARDAGIADSRFRHEQLEFDRLCVGLAKRAWAACFRSQNSEEARVACERWRAAHRELVCSQQRVRSRYGGASEPAPTFACVCAACGALWESRQRAKFCSRRCARRRPCFSPRDSPASRILDFLRTHPGSSSREIWRALSMKPHTVRKWLARARVTGFVIAQGRAGRRGFWIGLQGNPTGVSEWTLRRARIPSGISSGDADSRTQFRLETPTKTVSWRFRPIPTQIDIGAKPR
jgi:hypothetical protein